MYSCTYYRLLVIINKNFEACYTFCTLLFCDCHTLAYLYKLKSENRCTNLQNNYSSPLIVIPSELYYTEIHIKVPI